jgi:hypothetical protein
VLEKYVLADRRQFALGLGGRQHRIAFPQEFGGARSQSDRDLFVFWPYRLDTAGC